MQSYVISGDPCEEFVESAELNETLVKEDGLGRERESEGAEVDSKGSERLSDGREASCLKPKMGSVNVVEGNNDASDGNDGKDLVPVEGLINQESPVKANFNSFAQQLFPNPVNVGRCGKEVEVEKTVDDPSVEVTSQAAMNQKEGCGVDVEGGGHKGVSLVVDLGECVRDGKKNGKKKGGFCASDLVWGKVKSHPWWPAQIFEPGDASDKARKYFKSKGYFVGYFGDQTFAWNDEAKLKPFAPNFSQLVKQTQMEAFRHAVDRVLDETSRRVEFGLSCRCIVDDVYNHLKTQVIENAGIREQSRIREGGDRFFTASSFEPMKFLDNVKDLAIGLHADVDRLEQVIARAQMAAFYRWKGVYHLAEFGLLLGYVNNEADTPVSAQKEKREVIADEAPPPETMEEDDTILKKRKKTSGDSRHSIKKVRCLSDLTGKKGIRKKDDEEPEGKVGGKSISSSVRRRKEVKSFSNVSRTKECSPLGTPMQHKDTKPFFRVGESILRVAGQLNQPSPLLKLDASSHGKTIKNEEA